MLPFTPQREPAADLAARTIGREPVLAGLHDKLMAAALTPGRPHVMLVGERGSGKTHLVEVALARAAAEPAFAERVAVVRLPEDVLDITRFEDLSSAVPPGRAAVLVVERLDRVFDDLGLPGQRALRAWLETEGDVMLLATAPRLFPAVLQRDQPWFGGIAVYMLPGLNAEQGADLLQRLAAGHGRTALAEYVATPVGAGRVRALTALTGGAPRLWTLLAERATADDIDAVLPALTLLLEALVPQQQLALAALSPNERRLVAALGRTGAARVSDLAAAAQVEQRTAAASLGRLAAAGWVSSRKPARGDRRTTYYYLRDPMLRHHLAYREGRDEPLASTADLLRAHYGGGPTASLPTDSAGLAGSLLAAAAGDEAAMLSLPPELLPLLEPDAPRWGHRTPKAQGGE